ncbi:MAG: transketolase C-terminal domain-containing protein [Bilophila sp.]
MSAWPTPCRLPRCWPGGRFRTRAQHAHTVKPVDAEAVLRAAEETGAVVTAENHSVIGGLGSAVAEVLAEGRPAPLERVGVKDHFGQVGKAPYLMGVFGITHADIAKAARKALARKTLTASLSRHFRVSLWERVVYRW